MPTILSILEIVAIGAVAVAIYLRTTVVIMKDPDMPGLKQQIAALAAKQTDPSTLVSIDSFNGLAKRVGDVEHAIDNTDPDPVPAQDGTVIAQAAG
ncbi:hypothetical protein U1839_06145 [Sphingomonas sp. RT2P30]|uniref:hypothetical protein n=1 Tax=Parasphingomonas halimpatiens TaxID=3096162 RepID=UPI002FC6BABF